MLIRNTGQINQAVGEPWTVPGAASEWHGEGAMERARQNDARLKMQAMQADLPPATDTPPPRFARPPSRGPVPTMVQPTGVQRPTPPQPVPQRALQPIDPSAASGGYDVPADNLWNCLPIRQHVVHRLYLPASEADIQAQREFAPETETWSKVGRIGRDVTSTKALARVNDINPAITNWSLNVRRLIPALSTDDGS
jgi:hypothetical protein